MACLGCNAWINIFSKYSLKNISYYSFQSTFFFFSGKKITRFSLFDQITFELYYIFSKLIGLYRNRILCAFLNRQQLFIKSIQRKPGSTKCLNKIQNIIKRQSVIRYFLDISKSFLKQVVVFLQKFFVDRVSLGNVFFEYLRCSLTEFCPCDRINTISYSNQNIEVVVINLSFYTST